jgi:hypothetical protein
MAIGKARKALIGFSVALAFLLDCLMGVPGFGGAAFMITLFVLFARILIKSFRPRYAPPTATAWLALAMFLEGLAVGVLAIAQTHANQREAIPIVQALDAYCHANGAVPATLEGLVPDYLEALPTIRQGVMNSAIRYLPGSKKSCSFMLLVPGFPAYGYWFDSTTHDWSYHFD